MAQRDQFSSVHHHYFCFFSHLGAVARKRIRQTQKGSPKEREREDNVRTQPRGKLRRHLPSLRMFTCRVQNERQEDSVTHHAFHSSDLASHPARWVLFLLLPLRAASR